MVAEQQVRIIVTDLPKRQTRTFQCDVQSVKKTMSYFCRVIELQQAGLQPTELLTIHVNCDITIFAWLMEYISNQYPAFSVQNVVSLILSSHFLQMDTLRSDASDFLVANLATVLLSDVNMECVPNSLLTMISERMTFEALAVTACSVLQVNPQCPNRLFFSHLVKESVLLRSSGNHPSRTLSQLPVAVLKSSSCVSSLRPVVLQWCRHCGELFDPLVTGRMAQLGYPIPCPALLNGFIGPRGEMCCTHIAEDMILPIMDGRTLALSHNSNNNNNMNRTPPLDIFSVVSTNQRDSFGPEWMSWKVIGCCFGVICAACGHGCTLSRAKFHAVSTSTSSNPTSASSSGCSSPMPLNELTGALIVNGKQFFFVDPRNPTTNSSSRTALLRFFLCHFTVAKDSFDVSITNTDIVHANHNNKEFARSSTTSSVQPKPLVAALTTSGPIVCGGQLPPPLPGASLAVTWDPTLATVSVMQGQVWQDLIRFHETSLFDRLNRNIELVIRDRPDSSWAANNNNNNGGVRSSNGAKWPWTHQRKPSAAGAPTTKRPAGRNTSSSVDRVAFR